MSLRAITPIFKRTASTFQRPAPPRLREDQQREFEELQRTANSNQNAEADLALHPDARTPLASEFDGDVNPKTGERNGPKQEPVRQWNEGDWSFKGRVSDF